MMRSSEFGDATARVDMRVATMSPDGEVLYDNQFGYPGDEGPVSHDEKMKVIAEAARRIAVLLKIDPRDQLVTTFQAGNPDEPGLVVRFGPHSAEDCIKMKSNPATSMVWTAHCAAESSKYRLWWGSEPFSEFATEEAALEYLSRSHLLLRMTPPNRSRAHYRIAFIQAVVDNM